MFKSRKALMVPEFLIALSILILIFGILSYAVNSQKYKENKKIDFERCKNLAKVIEYVYLSDGLKINYTISGRAIIFDDYIKYKNVTCTFNAEVMPSIVENKFTIYNENGTVKFR